jgi:CSLREA domain-containing protein
MSQLQGVSRLAGATQPVRLVLAGFVLVLVFVVGASAAHAATLTVTTLSDNTVNDGQCSLREAITNANAASQVYSDCPAGDVSANTIEFTTSGTITLSSDLPGITGVLTVDGSGQTVTISGRSSYSIFRTSNTLSLKDLTLTNADVGGEGGAVLSSGPSLSLSSCTFKDNRAGYSSDLISDGGAIYNGFGSLQVTDSTFSDNLSLNTGGAIASEGSVTLRRDTFTGNSSGAGGALEGAAAVTVSNSTFSSNTASNANGSLAPPSASRGGAIDDLSASPVTVSGSSFSGNSSSHVGGAVSVSGPLSITASSLSANDATEGGAVEEDTGASISASVFSGNSAQSGGGAVDAPSGGALTIANDTFFINSAPGSGGIGGAIFSETATTVSFSTLYDNTATYGGDIATATGFGDTPGLVVLRRTILAAGTGGDCFGDELGDGGYNIADDGTCGLSNANHSLSNTNPDLGAPGPNTLALLAGSPAIDLVPVSACTAANGSPLVVDARGYTRPADGNLDGLASCDAGAYEYGSVPRSEAQTGPVFDVNTTADSHEPVCLQGQFGSCSLHDAVMMANAYSLQRAHKPATVQLTAAMVYPMDVVDNTPADGANALPVVLGAVTVNGGGATIERVATAPGMRLLQVDKRAKLTIADTRLRGGDPINNGGAIVNFGTLTLVQSFVHDNTSGGAGGGLFNAGTAVVHSSTLSANTAGSGGGAIFSQHSLQVANSTLTGNTGSRGGAIDSSGGAVTLVNATVSFDSATAGAKEVAISAGSVSFVNAIIGYTVGAINCAYGKKATHKDERNNLDSGTSCEFSSANGSRSDIPPGVGALADYGGLTPTMQLLAGSPAIDSGNNGVCAAAPINNVDQRGVARITAIDPVCDIGAFEYQG